MIDQVQSRPVSAEPEYLAGPPLFTQLLAATLFVVLGGAVVGTLLTRELVLRDAFTPWIHALMVLSAVAISAILTTFILRQAFRPLRAVRQALDDTYAAGRPRPASLLSLDRYGDPDIAAVAHAVRSLWDRLDHHVRLLQDSNARLEEQRRELATKTEELQRLATQVIAAQEEERRRIARELHDGTMQSLAALIMGLDRGLQAMPADVPHLRASHQTVARLRDLATQTLDELRHLAMDLRPAVLDDHGLVAALRWLVDRHEQRGGPPAQIELAGSFRSADGETLRFSPAIETAIFRIAQEALANVAKHAQASRVRLRLWHAGGAVGVEIEDDGIGIGEIAGLPPNHMGLLNMRERAALLGGTCRVERVTPSGTRVRVEVPAHTCPPRAQHRAVAAGAAAGAYPVAEVKPAVDPPMPDGDSTLARYCWRNPSPCALGPLDL